MLNPPGSHSSLMGQDRKGARTDERAAGPGSGAGGRKGNLAKMKGAGGLKPAGCRKPDREGSVFTAPDLTTALPSCKKAFICLFLIVRVLGGNH